MDPLQIETVLPPLTRGGFRVRETVRESEGGGEGNRERERERVTQRVRGLNFRPRS